MKEWELNYEEAKGKTMAEVRELQNKRYQEYRNSKDIFSYWIVEVVYSWDRTSDETVYNFRTKEQAYEFYRKKKAEGLPTGYNIYEPVEVEVLFEK